MDGPVAATIHPSNRAKRNRRTFIDAALRIVACIDSSIAGRGANGEAKKWLLAQDRCPALCKQERRVLHLAPVSSSSASLLRQRHRWMI
uniref:Uncharacterized protein n=1 Tax=Peronospora matthiolae TaxID=2874970 RepID=A0AAV1V6L2_9STRA